MTGASGAHLRPPGTARARARRLLGLLALATLLLGGLPATARTAPDAAPVPAESVDEAQRDGRARVLVALRADAEPEGRLDAAARDDQRRDIRAVQRRVARALPDDGSRVTHEYRTVPALAATVTREGLRALAGHEEVRHVAPDRTVTVGSASPALADSTQHTEADRLHLDGVDGAGGAIAVLDTGVDVDHPAFGDRVVAEACFASREDDPFGGECPNGERQMVGEGAAEPLPETVEVYWHGTHVAGIAVGQQTETPELADGLAPGAGLVAVQVFHVDEDEEGNEVATARLADVAAALDWLVDEGDELGVMAANLSLAGDTYESETVCTVEHPVLADAADQLRSLDIAPVASSGNQGHVDRVGAPACVEGFIAVGATDTTVDDPEVADFSNQAEFLDLMAPGTGIRSAEPDGGARSNSGTSMAVPHVSGGFALLRQATGRTSVEAILEGLVETGAAVPDTREGADGAEYPDIRLAAAREHLGATLDGTVRSAATGEPIGDVTVTADDGDTQATGARTDDDGDYALHGLAPGEYTVTAALDGYDPAEATVDVPSEGATQDFELDPHPPGRVRDLAASASADAVTLTWARPAGGGPVTEYVVRRDGDELSTVDERELVDGDVTSGTTHRYTVRATGPGGTGDASSVTTTVPYPTLTFSDVHPDDVHADAIGRMAGRGVIQGYDDGTFRPANPLTRAQAASLLVRALDVPDSSRTGTFSDVGPDFVHAEAIEAASAAGIVEGYDDGTFRPQQALNRAQAASMLVRAFELPLSSSPSPFSDVAAGPPHGDNIITAAEHEMVRGYDDGTFRPGELLTRAQAASMLDRILDG